LVASTIGPAVREKTSSTPWSCRARARIWLPFTRAPPRWWRSSKDNAFGEIGFGIYYREERISGFSFAKRSTHPVRFTWFQIGTTESATVRHLASVTSAKRPAPVMRAAIVGIGTVGFGRFPDESAASLANRALVAALDDAGLDRWDVDGLAVHIGS